MHLTTVTGDGFYSSISPPLYLFILPFLHPFNDLQAFFGGEFAGIMVVARGSAAMLAGHGATACDFPRKDTKGLSVIHGKVLK